MLTSEEFFRGLVGLGEWCAVGCVEVTCGVNVSGCGNVDDFWFGEGREYKYNNAEVVSEM